MSAIRTRWLGVLIAGAAAISLGLIAVNAAPARAADEDFCIASPSNGNCNGLWIQEGDACWLGSKVLQSTNYGNQGWIFETDLRWSGPCQSNFSVTRVIQAGPLPYEYSGKVRRGSGPDGPYLMEHGGWWLAGPFGAGGTPDVLSPLVYAPNNLAQACFSTRANDQATCTPWD